MCVSCCSGAAAACRAGLSSGAGLTDFADDVADLVATSTALEGGKSTGLSDLFGKHRLSQQYGADLAMQQRAQVGGSGVQVLRLVLIYVADGCQSRPDGRLRVQ